MLDKDTVERITNWAKGQKATDYGNKYFGPLFTDNLRRTLRSLAIDSPDKVRGSWRQGYSIQLADGSTIGIGTTRGCKLFCVFYNPPFVSTYQPPTAEQILSWKRS